MIDGGILILLFILAIGMWILYGPGPISIAAFFLALYDAMTWLLVRHILWKDYLAGVVEDRKTALLKLTLEK